MYTVRSLSVETDSPDKLKNAISEQYGDLLPPVDKMEIGYFHQGKKMWIKNRLDLNGVWKLAHKGERVTLWSMGVATEASTSRDTQKRPLDKMWTERRPTTFKTSKNTV